MSDATIPQAAAGEGSDPKQRVEKEKKKLKSWPNSTQKKAKQAEDAKNKPAAKPKKEKEGGQYCSRVEHLMEKKKRFWLHLMMLLEHTILLRVLAAGGTKGLSSPN